MSNFVPKVLFSIGAQKAGTTWLYNYFRDHPSVHVPPEKELHYFDTLGAGAENLFVRERLQRIDAVQGDLGHRVRDYFHRQVRPKLSGNEFGVCTRGECKLLVRMHTEPSKTHDVYRDVLQLRYKGEPVIADVTPNYEILSKRMFAEMARGFPDAKVLYVMRDPVERALSHIRMNHTNKLLETPDLSFERFIEPILKEAPFTLQYIQRSLYPKVIRRLESAVPKDRILYLFYEDLFTDTSMRKLCQFLEIPFKKGAYDRVTHEGKGPRETHQELRGYLQAKLARVYPQVEQKFGAAVPEAWCKNRPITPALKRGRWSEDQGERL